MKRKAILIESSNVAGQTDLPGARKDIENWHNFLTSELGGKWESSDIQIFRKPYFSAVETALNVHADCYCLVAFSGHGSEGSVVLNETYVNISIEKLRPKTEKGTLIVDSCRGVIAVTESVIKAAQSRAEVLDEQVTANLRSGRTMTFNSSAINQQTHFSDKSQYTSKWEESLKYSARGIVEMFSCSKGQGAGENASAGGYYTSLLMQAAEIFSRENSTGVVQSTKQAHDRAAALIPAPQRPEYRPSTLAFPFAVSL